MSNQINAVNNDSVGEMEIQIIMDEYSGFQIGSSKLVRTVFFSVFGEGGRVPWEGENLRVNGEKGKISMLS